MNSVRTIGSAFSIAAITLLTACASAPKPEPVIEDWTNRACESPAYRSILGNYAGQIVYRDNDARGCLWNTQVSIIGVSMVAECSLTGSITATADGPGNDGYECSNVSAAPTRFVVGVAGEDLNYNVPTSVIVHLENEPPMSNSRGDSLMYPIIQFEALTAENGVLITDAGNILNRQ